MRERLLLFKLDERRFAVRGSDVVEVLRAAAITPLPGAPAVVAGVVDVRGAVRPVYDLRRRFGLPEKPLGVFDRFVVVQTARRTALLRCDQEVTLDDVDAAAVDDARGLGGRSPVLAGAVKLSGDVVFLCDVDAFLDAAESAQLDAALERALDAAQTP